MGRFGQLQAGQAASIQSHSGRGEVVFHSFMALVQRGKKEAHQHAGATDTRMSLTWGIERGGVELGHNPKLVLGEPTPAP